MSRETAAKLTTTSFLQLAQLIRVNKLESARARASIQRQSSSTTEKRQENDARDGSIENTSV